MDEVEPLLVLTLYATRLYALRLHEFLVVGNEFVMRAGSSSKRDYLDAVVQTLGSMNKTTRSRQASMLTWDVRSGSTASCD